MIVAPKFPGDTDAHVIDMQHRLYGQSIGLFASEVISHFLFASAVTDGALEIAEKLKQVRERGIDHRILQAVHDQVAAHFRQTNVGELQPALPLEGAEAESLRVERRWMDFWAFALKWICEDAWVLRTAAQCIATSGGHNDSFNEGDLLQMVSSRFAIRSTH